MAADQVIGDRELAGRAALVTGASRGIGRGIALALAQAGADIVVNYRSDAAGAEATASLVEDAGARALVIQADVGIESEVDAMFEHLLATFGRIDVLVNNAGHGGGRELTQTSFADFERVMRSNLYGPLFCAQRAAHR